MDKEYMKLCTRSWELLGKHKAIEFYSFFDTVDWNTRYAIKKNGELAYDFDDNQHGNNYQFFEAVCKIL